MHQKVARSVLGYALVFWVLASSSWSADVNTPRVATVTESDRHSKVEIRVGQELRVELRAQLGTGYSWQVDSDSTDLLVQKASRSESSTALPGKPEMQVIVLKAIHAGHGTLKLDYRRPWEKDVAPTKTFVLYVTVKSIT